MRRLALLALALPLLAPVPASAATVSVAVGGYQYQTMRVAAGPGEANRIRVTGSRETMEVTDTGAPLRAGPGCTATDTGAVRCADIFEVHVLSGDGNDEVRIGTFTGNAGATIIEAGPGDDTVAGGERSNWIEGGGGRDRLTGGPGCDGFADGDAPGAPDADVIDGGAEATSGCDVVDYSTRRAPVAVRLDSGGSARDAGQAGEGDVLTGIDGAYGGRGDDVLHASDAGSQGPNERGGLEGGRGDDVLIGGDGMDAIDASAGRDRVRAGGGDDDVTLSYARDAARVDCGSGFDYATFAGRRDVLTACDSIAPEDELGTFTVIPVGRGALRLDNFDAPVRVVVRVHGGRLDGQVVARRTFRSKAGRRLHVTRLGRRLARRGARHALRVELRSGRRRSGFRLSPGRARAGARSSRPSRPGTGPPRSARPAPRGSPR